MSLIPSADAGAPGKIYFSAAENGIMRGPSIFPLEGNYGAGAATLSMHNGGVTDPSGHKMNVIHYVTAKTGGGLEAGTYQCFMYGPDVGDSGIGELFIGLGMGNGYAMMGMNRAGPLEPGRMGKITGTGAPQVVNSASITAASIVNLAFVGGTPAAGDVAITITPNTSFTLTLPLGAVYNYEIIG
jgi:hypothetical protein